MFEFSSLFSKVSRRRLDTRQIQRRSLYSFTKSKNVDLLLNKATELKNEINAKKNLIDPSLQSVIQQKIKYSWTYHSNAIEGNTLSLGDTIFFLQEGITVGGKPFKDFLDVKNHSDAIDFLYDIVSGEREIDESLFREINKILLTGVSSIKTFDANKKMFMRPSNPGEYKKTPNYVLQRDGTIHSYVEPYLVPIELGILAEYINKNIKVEHPIITASIAHYNMVKIHPFEDGNGRGARILMNLILIKGEYPAAIIKVEDRARYLDGLKKADDGEINPFIEFIAESSIQTQEIILSEIKNFELKNGDLSGGLRF